MMNTKMKLVLGTCLIAAGALAADAPNLVPTEPAEYSPHYWCTWYAQNYWQQLSGIHWKIDGGDTGQYLTYRGNASIYVTDW